MPCLLNGTALSAEEFRDSLRPRCGFQPGHLPSHCDGCLQRNSIEHALSCKKGGLIRLRHNELTAEWHQLCATAFAPAAVTDKPLMCQGQLPQEGSTGDQSQLPPDIRGDVAVRGFWQRSSTATFDVRIVDTDAPSYRGQNPIKVLANHEKRKKDKYLEPCLARRRQFTPLVFSVDGVAGTEAKAASQRLASRLAAKWKRPYSHLCGYIRSRLSTSLVRTTSLCLRGARGDPSARSPPPLLGDGQGLVAH